jgi:NAD(P)-dependent dehydrogenase (short-subunit alcohol dehydrogenase family)
MNGTLPFDGRVVVITGAASGQGYAAAKLFAEQGAQLALLDWHNDAGQKLLVELTAAGKTAMFVHVDLSDEMAVEAACKSILGRFSHVDVLFNNAGIGFSENKRFKMASVFETPLADWNAIIAINLTSMYLMIRFLGPSMIARRSGSIINNASVAGIVGVAGWDAYTASKGGVVSLSRALAAALGQHNIRVNCIAPGAIATAMLQPFLDAGGFEDRLPGIPLGRIGVAEDIAGLAVFLGSDASSYITGQIIAVDGGRTAI